MYEYTIVSDIKESLLIYPDYIKTLFLSKKQKKNPKKPSLLGTSTKNTMPKGKMNF